MNIKVFGLSLGILIISIAAALTTACTNNQYPAGYGYSPYYGGYRTVNVYSPRYVGGPYYGGYRGPYYGGYRGPYYGGYRGAYGYGYRGGRW